MLIKRPFILKIWTKKLLSGLRVFVTFFIIFLCCQRVMNSQKLPKKGPSLLKSIVLGQSGLISHGIFFLQFATNMEECAIFFAWFGLSVALSSLFFWPFFSSQQVWKNLKFENVSSSFKKLTFNHSCIWIWFLRYVLKVHKIENCINCINI